MAGMQQVEAAIGEADACSPCDASARPARGPRPARGDLAQACSACGAAPRQISLRMGDAGADLADHDAGGEVGQRAPPRSAEPARRAPRPSVAITVSPAPETS